MAGGSPGRARRHGAVHPLSEHPIGAFIGQQHVSQHCGRIACRRTVERRDSAQGCLPCHDHERREHLWRWRLRRLRRVGERLLEHVQRSRGRRFWRRRPRVFSWEHDHRCRASWNVPNIRGIYPARRRWKRAVFDCSGWRRWEWWELGSEWWTWWRRIVGNAAGNRELYVWLPRAVGRALHRRQHVCDVGQTG